MRNQIKLADSLLLDALTRRIVEVIQGGCIISIPDLFQEAIDLYSLSQEEQLELSNRLLKSMQG